MRKKIQWLILTLLVFIFSSQIMVDAAGLSIYYEGKTVSYTDKQLKVTVQGENVDIRKFPGILADGTAMVPYIHVFNKKVNVTSKYNSKNKSITFKANKNTVVVTIGSKTAVINGKKVSMKAAPKVVLFRNTKISKIMVPSRAIADGLGLDYNYSNGTVSISKKKAVTYQGRAIQYGGKIYDYVKKEVGVKVDGKKMNLAMPGLILNNVAMLPAHASFAKTDLDIVYEYDAKAKTVTLSNFDHIIVYTLDSKTAKVDGKNKALTEPAKVIKDVASGVNYVFVPGSFTATGLGLDYAWDNNSVTSLIYSTKEEEETNTKDPSETVTEDGDSTEATEPGEGTTEPENNQTANYSVRVPIPAGVKMEEIYETDDYWNRQYIITVPSDQLDYYKKNVIANSKKHAKSISTRLNSDGDTEILIKTNTIKGFQVTNNTKYIYVTIKTPKQTYDQIVVIDAGHGGTDPGASGNGLVEKNLTLQITKAAKSYFDQDESIKVYYTRLTEHQAGITKGSGVASTIISAKNRALFANEIGADLLISVHINSHNATARGVETEYSSRNTSKNEGGLTSKQLATYAYNNLVTATGAAGIQKRGVKDYKNLAILYNASMPATLMEVCFLSNKEDAAILKADKKIDTIGKSIYTSVLQAFDNYPTTR